MFKDLFRKNQNEPVVHASDPLNFQLATENASSQIILTDVDAKITYVNKAAEKNTGYTKEELVGKTPSLWGGQMGESFYQQMWHTIKEEKKSFSGIVKNKRKNGEIYSAQIVISPILDEKQNLIGFASLENDISNQVVASEATGMSELRYRRLFETAQDGILILSFETGIIQDVNKFLIDILGYTKEELLTKHLWEVGLFANEAAQKENFQTLQREGYVRFEDLPLETKDKKQIHVEFVANAYKVGEETVIQCNVRDITERVRAEVKVKWLASFPTLNPKPIVEIDKKMGIAYINPTAKTLFPDLSGLNLSHPFVLESERYFEELISQEKNTDRRVLLINGRWYQQDIRLVSLERLRIYGSDITDLKNIEYKLAIGKSYDEAILSSIGEGVVVCDRDGKINLFNKKSEELIGLTAGEVIGTQYANVINMVNEKDGSDHEDILAKTLASGTVAKIEKQVMLLTSQGVRISIAGVASPVRGSDGSTMGAVLAFYDATRERDIDKAKTEFVSLASHQMRTPLTAINWYSEMMLAEKHSSLDDDQTKFTNEIHSASKRMSALVNSLLNISRLEMGTFVIEPVLLNVVDVAEENIALLTPQIQTRKINLQKEFEPNLGVFLADPKLMGIIFLNLLSNAVKYTPAGGSIRLMVKKEDDLLKIAVSDTGVGIPKEDYDKIFGKLFRSENAKMLDPGGTGLGLYIVHEVVINSGGRIWFESEVGKGTAFYVTFPLTGMTKKAGDKRII